MFYVAGPGTRRPPKAANVFGPAAHEEAVCRWRSCNAANHRAKQFCSRIGVDTPWRTGCFADNFHGMKTTKSLPEVERPSLNTSKEKSLHAANALACKDIRNHTAAFHAPAGHHAPGSNGLNQIATTSCIPAPLSLVYNEWTRFPAFPHFMRGRNSIPNDDGSRMVLSIDIDGKPGPWEAEVLDVVPNSHIVWGNVHGRPCPNKGAVHFECIGDDTTRATIEAQFDLAPGIHGVFYPLRSVALLVDRSLQTFCKYIRDLVARSDASMQGGRPA